MSEIGDWELRMVTRALEDLTFAIQEAKEAIRPWPVRAALIDCESHISGIRYALKRGGVFDG